MRLSPLIPATAIIMIGAVPAAPQDAPPPGDHVHITVTNGYRYIVSDGIPNHETGPFPNRNNPNRIQLQYHRFRVPEKPVAAARPTPFSLMPFGVALNGVPFDPGAAEFWNGDRNWQFEALSGKINLGLDRNNAHVQPTGAYHYHGSPTGLIASLNPAADMLLLGYAADGFPIYAGRGYRDPANPASGVTQLRSSYQVKSGLRPSGPGGPYDGTFVQDYVYVPGSGDLDECNGRTGPTPEYPDGTYYYVVTDRFPFIPRCFRGTPDDSFQRRGPRPGGRDPGGMAPPPGHRPPPPPPSGRDYGYPPPPPSRVFRER